MIPKAPEGWFIMTMHQRHRDAGCYGDENMVPVDKPFVVALVRYPKGNHVQMAQGNSMDEAWLTAVRMTREFDASFGPNSFLPQAKTPPVPAPSEPVSLPHRDPLRPWLPPMSTVSAVIRKPKP